MGINVEQPEQGADYKIALNFLKVEQKRFEFVIHIIEKNGNSVIGNDAVHSYRIPNNEGVYSLHWVSFTQFDGSVEYTCASTTNKDLTNKYLEYILVNKVTELFGPEMFSQNKGRFNNGIVFYTRNHEEGKEAIDIRPYQLRIDESFGFLVNYRFINNNTLAGRRIQQLSLSLDARGYSNKDYYIDILGKMHEFLKAYFNPVFTNWPNSISTSKKLYVLEAETLNERLYLIGDEVKVSNPFLGLKQKNSKPLREINAEVVFYFLYEKGEGDYAKSILAGLKGKAFPNIFPGIEDFFGIANSSEVKANYLHDWTENGIKEKISEIKAIKDKKVITIALLPSKESADNKNKYYQLKYHFTNAKIPIQIITKSLVSNSRAFEFSVANIALQIFCKLGGYPWKVEPSNDNCLIVGLGQSYSYTYKEGERRVLEKQLAYSVLTDSSGIFKSIQVLANSNDNTTYLNELESNLLNIVNSSTQGFSKVAIHTPFKLNRPTIYKLADKCRHLGIELVILVINDENDFFGFHTSGNTLLPYESTYVKISENEYLMWFEGLKKDNPKAFKRVPGPIYVQFLHHTREDFDENQRKQYLQDCINLSGANWKGFKAKNVPVSMYYCQEIAKFLKNFKEIGLNESSFENNFPWFL